MAAGADAAIFFDRDGTVIEDVGYPRDPASVRLLDGAAEALAQLGRAGFRLVVVSNQSGIGRGVPLEEAVELADRAAGIVVGKAGTSTVTLEELEEQVEYPT